MYMIEQELNPSFFLRSVCLHDALSFYANKKSCGFYKRDFTEVFIGICCAICLVSYRTPQCSCLKNS